MKRFGEIIYTPESEEDTALAKRETHTPRIEAPDVVKSDEPFEVKVSVGPHPNTVEHSIRWIEVYFYEEGRPYNPILLSRVYFEPSYAEPKVLLTLKLKKSGVIHALEYCNLHGLWENRKEIKVE